MLSAWEIVVLIMALINRLEFERLAWPVSSLVLLAVSFLCLVIAIGTPGWVQVVYNACKLLI